MCRLLDVLIAALALSACHSPTAPTPAAPLGTQGVLVTPNGTRIAYLSDGQPGAKPTLIVAAVHAEGSLGQTYG